MTKRDVKLRRGLLIQIGMLDAMLYRRRIDDGRKKWERWVNRRRKAMGL